MNLPSNEFLELNKKRFLQSQAVKSSNRKYDLKKIMRFNKHKNKVRKQILLTHSENSRLEALTQHFSLSNSVVVGYCLNEFYDYVINPVQRKTIYDDVAALVNLFTSSKEAK